MNLLHMKYALMVAKCGSINKAAEALLMNQPNLSRAIRELETSLGVEIFARSAKGMVVTPEGETFLSYANSILKQVEEVKDLFKKSAVNKKRFSISVPKAGYISEAFSNFSLAINHETDAEFFYDETSSEQAIKNILELDNYDLGMIRYAGQFDKYYKEKLDEKGFAYELAAEFQYVVIMSADSRLAQKEEISVCDLEPFIEIAHADPCVPALPFAGIRKEDVSKNRRRRIFVFERANQYELLAKNPEVFMWASPIPRRLLDRYGLTQRKCRENTRVYRDLIIRRKEYQLTELDNLFLAELKKLKEELLL